MNQKTAFSGRKKDPVFLGKNRLTHPGHIFQWKECSELYTRGETPCRAHAWCCSTLLTIRGQKTYPKDRQPSRLFFFFCGVKSGVSCSLWSLGASPPALEECTVCVPAAEGQAEQAETGVLPGTQETGGNCDPWNLCYLKVYKTLVSFWGHGGRSSQPPEHLQRNKGPMEKVQGFGVHRLWVRMSSLKFIRHKA